MNRKDHAECISCTGLCDHFKCSFVFYMYEHFAYMYVCACLMTRGQKKVLYPLELEVQAVMKQDVGAGN